MSILKLTPRKVGGPVFKFKGYRVECGYSSWPTPVVAQAARIDLVQWQWKQWDALDSFGVSILWRQNTAGTVEARLINWA